MRRCRFRPLAQPIIRLGIAWLALSLPAAAQDRLPPGSLRAQLAQIVDRQGFERPMPAVTLLVPAGWKVQSEVAWARGPSCGRPYHPRLLAQSPDGQSAIEIFGGETWGTSSYGPPVPNCPVANLSSAEAFLRAWVQRHRPGAQWLGYKPNPARQRQPQNTPMPAGFMRSGVDAGQAQISWQRNGQTQHEWLGTVVSLNASRLQMPGVPPADTLIGEATGVISWRAPAGQLSEKLFGAIWQSLQTDPQWAARIQAGMQQMAADNAATQQRIAQIQAQGARDTMAQMQKRHEIRMQTQQDIATMRNQGWQNQQAQQDRQQRATVDTINEVRRYRNPDGAGTVALPQYWQHAWKLRDGSYLLTDSPNFDPGRDLGVAGQKLELAPR